MPYNYSIKPLAIHRIRTFYWHVMEKYPNTYSYYDMLKYVNETVDAIYRIESTLLRRKPTIKQWQEYHMAHAGSWYYAYTIEGNNIVIHDACHKQNMT